MPEVISSCEGVAAAAIAAVDEMDVGGGGEDRGDPAAPRTPKRAAAMSEERAADAATPAKHPRQGASAPVDEPTNHDLMTFLRQMQASQDRALRGVTARLSEAEVRMATSTLGCRRPTWTSSASRTS